MNGDNRPYWVDMRKGHEGYAVIDQEAVTWPVFNDIERRLRESPTMRDPWRIVGVCIYDRERQYNLSGILVATNWRLVFIDELGNVQCNIYFMDIVAIETTYEEPESKLSRVSVLVVHRKNMPNVVFRQLGAVITPHLISYLKDLRHIDIHVLKRGSWSDVHTRPVPSKSVIRRFRAWAYRVKEWIKAQHIWLSLTIGVISILIAIIGILLAIIGILLARA